LPGININLKQATTKAITKKATQTIFNAINELIISD